MNKYIINGIAVAFQDDEPHTQEEARAYLEHARKQHNNIASLLIKRDGEYADLSYTMETVPFERIRRITGYLVGTTDRFNNAKRSELNDRVKHDGEGQTSAKEAEAPEQPEQRIRPGDFILHKPTGEECVFAFINYTKKEEPAE